MLLCNNTVLSCSASYTYTQVKKSFARTPSRVERRAVCIHSSSSPTDRAHRGFPRQEGRVPDVLRPHPEWLTTITPLSEPRARGTERGTLGCCDQLAPPPPQSCPGLYKECMCFSFSLPVLYLYSMAPTRPLRPLALTWSLRLCCYRVYMYVNIYIFVCVSVHTCFNVQNVYTLTWPSACTGRGALVLFILSSTDLMSQPLFLNGNGTGTGTWDRSREPAHLSHLQIKCTPLSSLLCVYMFYSECRYLLLLSIHPGMWYQLFQPIWS